MGSSSSILKHENNIEGLLKSPHRNREEYQTVASTSTSNGCVEETSYGNKMAIASKSRLLLNALIGNRSVKYIPQIMGRKDNNIIVWWFPQDFCQSRLGDRVIGSNACTLIVILMAHRIHHHNITIGGNLAEYLSQQLISALAESIVDGNEIYEGLQKMGHLQYPTLTLPEAVTYYRWVKDELHMADRNLIKNQNYDIKELNNFVVVENSVKEKLFDVCHRGIMDWEMKNHASLSETSNLFLVLIADERSVLLVYQRHQRKVTLIDSHGHQNNGAVVSQTNISHLNELCEWYDNMCKSFFSSSPSSFEVSFLHYQATPLSV